MPKEVLNASGEPMGRRLMDRETRVRHFAEKILVGACLHPIGGLSAPADPAALLACLQRFETIPRRSLVVHGEPQPA